MSFNKEIAKYIPFVKKEEVSKGRIIFKTAAITTAILAFVPTVIKVNKGSGFDAYGILSHVKYKKSTGEDGKVRHDVIINLIDLERYGIDTKNKKQTEENNEDCLSIEE
ncbi:MAG: hypothetical protein E7649_03195 [Ruminococcaceae bacterium]|nr:hypothetical protein [Oscillospiraceae bacterium]